MFTEPEEFFEAVPVDDAKDWQTPTGLPVDRRGITLIPELNGRAPTHNENTLIAGFPIAMASSNVQEIWWHWGEGENYSPRLFVRFLNGSLYVYNGCSLTIAEGMIETMSPGRYVWNVLRVEFPTKGDGWGQYKCLIEAPKGGRKRRPQVVRLR